MSKPRDLAEFADFVRAQEREKCAKLLDQMANEARDRYEERKHATGRVDPFWYETVSATMAAAKAIRNME